MSSAIGMMDGAFFVGRKEIVDWINATLELSITKVEDTASGAVACQLFDIMHPNVIPMAKVNWAASKNFEYVGNYKLLQTGFTKMHINKFIDVDRLISGRYMDNLEFMQWFKRFFEMVVQEKCSYDCSGQRCKGKGGATYALAPKSGKTSGASSVAATENTTIATSKPRATAMPKPTQKPMAAAKSTPATAALAASSAAASTTTQKENKSAASNVSIAAAVSAAASAAKAEASAVSAIKVKELELEIAALKAANEDQGKLTSELCFDMDGLQKERDFYFDKLRDIEVLLQDIEDQGKGNDVTASIFKILYATVDGFEPISEDVDAPEVSTAADDLLVSEAESGSILSFA